MTVSHVSSERTALFTVMCTDKGTSPSWTRTLLTHWSPRSFEAARELARWYQTYFDPDHVRYEYRAHPCG